MSTGRTRPSRTARAATAAAMALLLAGPCLCAPAARGAQAGESPPPTDRRPFPTRGSSQPPRRAPGRPESAGSGGWWAGTAGVALALAGCGWLSVTARRYLPRSGASAAGFGLRVVGRTSLSPRHTVYLLRAGDRVLIVGTGPQGSPSLLGELDGPPDPDSDPDAGPAPAPAPARPRIDLRLGDRP
jgi:hypothetical protein